MNYIKWIIICYEYCLQYEIVEMYQKMNNNLDITLHIEVVLSPLAPIGKQIHISSPQ